MPHGLDMRHPGEDGIEGIIGILSKGGEECSGFCEGTAGIGAPEFLSGAQKTLRDRGYTLLHRAAHIPHGMEMIRH